MKVILLAEDSFTVICQPTDTFKKFMEEAFKAYDLKNPNLYANASFFSQAMKFYFANKELSKLNENFPLSYFNIDQNSNIKMMKNVLPEMAAKQNQIALEQAKSEKFSAQAQKANERNRAEVLNETPPKKSQPSFWGKISNTLFKPSSSKKDTGPSNNNNNNSIN